MLYGSYDANGCAIRQQHFHIQVFAHTYSNNTNNNGEIVAKHKRPTNDNILLAFYCLKTYKLDSSLFRLMTTTQQRLYEIHRQEELHENKNNRKKSNTTFIIIYIFYVK